MNRSPRITPSALIALLVTLLCPLALDAQQLPARGASRGGEAERERIADRYWNPLFTPDRYEAALRHIATMPDADGAADAKGGSSLMRTTRWEGIGPAYVRINPTIGWHGRMRAIRWYRNPVNDRLETYLGASSGGIWFGNFAILLRIWTSLGDNLENPSVGAFLVDSLDPNTIWLGTGDWARYGGTGLYRTTNRGGTWERIRLTGSDHRPWAITGLEYGANRSTMYLTGHSGFYRSTDGGATWERRTGTPANESIYDMVVDPTDRRTVYIAGAGNRGIARSTDGGTNWMSMNTGLELGKAGPTTAIAISASSPNILYAAQSDTSGGTGRIYRTTNRGTQWTATSAPLPYIAGGQAFHAHAIGVAPDDPNRVYVGSVGFIRTTDAGATWEWRESGHADVTSIEFLPGDSRYVYVLSDGGLFIHDDATNVARNQTEAFTPSAPIQAYSLEDAWSNSKVMVSGTQDNGTILTEEAGTRDQLWRSIGGCDGGNTIAIHPSDPNRIYFNSWCGPSNPRLLSKDMGRTSGDISYGLSEIYYTPLRMNKGNTNFPFTVTRTHLHYSDNEGAGWRRATTARDDFDTLTEAVRCMSVSFQSDAGVAAYTWFWDGRNTNGRRLKITRGTPGSMTTIARTMPGNEIIHQVIPDRWRASTAYAMTTTPNARIYRTTDQGETWTSITGNMPDVNTWDLVTLPSNPRVMFVATDLGVFRTRTDGGSWERWQHGLPIVGANSFSYIRGESFDTLRVATFGRGYWQRVVDGGDPLAFQLDTSYLGRVSLRDVAVVREGLGTLAPDTVVTVGDNGLIGVSVNGGRSFRFSALPSSVNLRGVFASDCTRVVAVGDDGTLLCTGSTGREWTPLQSGVLIALRGVRFAGQSGSGVAFGDDGVILHSTNHGAAWERVYDLKGASWYGATFVDEKNGWIVGGIDIQQDETPLLARTSDGGASWTLWQSPPNVLRQIEMTGADTGFAVGAGGLHRTTNGGSSWEQFPMPTKTQLTDLVVVNPRLVYVTTTDGRILRNEGTGDAWSDVENVQALGALWSITKGSKELIAVGDSTIAFVRLGDEPPVDTSMKPPFIENFSAGIETGSGTLGARIESIVPNPTSGATTIGFTLARRGAVSVAIHTLLGETIATLDERVLAAGPHSMTWDGASADGRPVPAGTYLVRIATATGVVAARVTVVR